MGCVVEIGLEINGGICKIFEEVESIRPWFSMKPEF